MLFSREFFTVSEQIYSPVVNFINGEKQWNDKHSLALQIDKTSDSCIYNVAKGSSSATDIFLSDTVTFIL